MLTGLRRGGTIVGLFLDDHLCHSLPTQSLTPHESLALKACQEVAGSCKKENDSGGNQAGRGVDETGPLNHTHHSINNGTRVISVEATDEFVEGWRSGTYAEEQRDLNEDEREARASVERISIAKLDQGRRHLNHTGI